MRRKWPVVALVLGLVALLALGVVWRSGSNTPISSTLLDRAQAGTWYLPGRAAIPIYTQGYDSGAPNSVVGFQESDYINVDGKYYLFSTGSQEPAWTDVYVGSTLEELIQGPPTFTKVAPIRYPTVVKDGNTWHLWGVDPTNKEGQYWTEHWISYGTDPTGFIFSDMPFLATTEPPLVDFAVRKHPTNGMWYGVGFETWENAPLVLARAPSPSGPWEKLNYEPHRINSGLFGDTGYPPWANASRPDPNLAFTPDGRAWVFFTGRATVRQPADVTWRAGMVQVNIDSGKAIGNAFVLFDPSAHKDLPFTTASDLVLVSVPGERERVLAYANSAEYPLLVLDIPDDVAVTNGRGTFDLVRLDMTNGFDAAVGMTPAIVESPYRWDAEGLDVSASADYGGATGYLASAYLADLTFEIDFTPVAISMGSAHVVGHIGGPDYDFGPGITVEIDAANGDPYIMARIVGNDNSNTVLNSGVVAWPYARYSVVLERSGLEVTLKVNGAERARATQGSVLTGLDEWSLGAQQTMTQTSRFSFQGFIHSFAVVGSELNAIHDPGK